MSRLVIYFSLLLSFSNAEDLGAVAKKIVLPSGEDGYSIRCDNLNMNICYEKAGEICFRGYDIRAETKDQGVESRGGAYLGPGFTQGTAIGFAGSNSKTTTEKGLLIVCNDPEATEQERKAREVAAEKERIEKARAAEAKRAESNRPAVVIIGGALALLIVATFASAQ